MNRSPQKIRIPLALVPWLFFSTASVAQIPNQVPFGARPIMMGEAFVAVADDGNAVYWNPAGLARMQRTQFSFGSANLFGFDINNRYGGMLARFFRLPGIPIDLRDYLAFGLNYAAIGTEDDELEFSHKQFRVSLALQAPRRWSYLNALNLGVNFKLYKMTADLLVDDLQRVPTVDVSGRGWDVGLLYDLNALPKMPAGLNFGLMVYDVGGTSGKHRTDKREKLHPQKTTWGLSYRPFDDWPWRGYLPISDPLLAFDVDDRVHVGLEFLLFRILALRAGWQKDRHTEEDPIWSFGFGLQTDPRDWFKGGSDLDLRRILFDVPLADSRAVHNSRQFEISVITKEDPRLIRIEAPNLNEVYASLYKHYENLAGALGKIRLHNVHNDTLTVGLRFIAPYTRKESESAWQEVKVPPDTSLEVKLEADFDENKTLQITSKEESATAKIEAKYLLRPREEYRTSENAKFNLYGCNYLTWDDPGKAAAFVTSSDRCLVDFAASVVKQEAKANTAVPFFTRNMVYGLYLYEAMRALGCDWVKDQTTPFSKVRKAGDVVDNIKYPAQLLASKSRAGDCDDLSVLYATLLESVGVEAALLSTDTHLFTMFNTDIPAGRKTSVPIDPSYFVPHHGTLWMPVETTAFPASFEEAWRKGKDKYLDEFPKIFAIADHQKEDRYPPASFTFAAACSVAVPNVSDAVSRPSAVIAGLKDSYLQKYMREIVKDRGNLPLRNTYATILGQNGQRREARAQLDTIFLILEQNKKRQKTPAQAGADLTKNLTYAAALNNLGNIEFMEGEFEKAESLYRNANLYNDNKDDKRGTYLNVIYLYAIWMAKDTVSEKIYRPKCIQALKEVRPLLNADPDEALKEALSVLNLTSPRLQGKGEKDEIDKKPPVPSTVLPDSLRKKSQQDTTKTPQPEESWLVKKAKSLGGFFSDYFKSLLEGPPPTELSLEGAAAKNDGELDDDRARILWWNVGLVLSNP